MTEGGTDKNQLGQTPSSDKNLREQLYVQNTEMLRNHEEIWGSREMKDFGKIYGQRTKIDVKFQICGR